MATKAEVQAAIEAIGIATARAAVVAAALEEGGGTEPMPPQTADVLITERAGQSLLITTRPGIDKVDWTIVTNQAPTYPWYSNALHKDVVVPAGGLAILPGYQRDGDFVKVLWANQTQWLDGPKDTKKNTQTPTQPPGGTNVIAKWRMGLNLERFRPGYMEWQGHLLTQPQYFTQYMPSIGCNWARYFIPFGSENDMGVGTEVAPDVSRFADIIESARVASQNGIGVSFGLTDVLEAWSLDQRWDAVQTNVRNVAREVSGKLDPTKVVLETANELGGGDNAYFNDKRITLHNIIREECPQHVIAHGCAGWNNNNWGADWADPPDRNVVLRYHRYQRGWWEQIDGCKEHAARLGTLIYGGEVMPEFGNGNYDDWGQNWMDGMANGGGAVGGWAVTDGRDFQMSVGGIDATLHAELEEWTKRVAATYS
jgi:hypothetical protein